MTRKFKTSQKGFTLVELAIVLVIIGLIVSGVLAGRDLIKAAELRATVRQVQTFQTAVNTFIGKYNGIPGDLNNGATFGLTGLAANQDGTAGDGDANGIITQDNATTVLQITGEMSTFWSHLTTSGKELIPGAYNGDNCDTSVDSAGVVQAAICYTEQDFPKLKFGSTGWVAYGITSTNYLSTGFVSDDSEVTNTTNDFVPLDAYNIDVKVDDGLPQSGDVFALITHATVLNTAATATVGAVAAGDCIDDGAADNVSPIPYYMAGTTSNCRLRFTLKTF